MHGLKKINVSIHEIKNISCVLLSKEQLSGKLLEAMPAMGCAFDESNVSRMKIIVSSILTVYCSQYSGSLFLNLRRIAAVYFLSFFR